MLGFFYGATAQLGPRQTTRQTVGRSLPNEQSFCRMDRYLHNTEHKRRTAISQVGFEPAIPAVGRPQTYALDSMVVGLGYLTEFQGLKDSDKRS